jgi:hypothetical protein
MEDVCMHKPNKCNLWNSEKSGLSHWQKLFFLDFVHCIIFKEAQNFLQCFCSCLQAKNLPDDWEQHNLSGPPE